MMTRWFVACSAAVAVVCVSAPLRGQGGGGPPPALVRVGQVKQEQLQERHPVVGRLREVRRVVVSAEQQGKVVEVSAEEGQPVVGGQTVLARIEDVWATMALSTALAQRAQAQADVEERSAKLDQALRDLGYLEELQKAGSAKPREVDDARSNVQALTAALENAKARVAEGETQVQRCQVDVEKLRVVAPFDGVVVKKMVEVGRFVTRGSEVAEIVWRGTIDAVIDVPERLVNVVSVGQEVEVKIEPLNRVVIGKVEAVIPDGSAAARTFPVKIRMDDLSGELKPGMSVTAKVPTTAMSAVLTVPRDAVLLGPGGATVWAAVEDKAMPISVEVLFGQGDRYAVRVSPRHTGPPLSAGQQVIIEGAERLMFPGQPLTIQG